MKNKMELKIIITLANNNTVHLLVFVTVKRQKNECDWLFHCHANIFTQLTKIKFVSKKMQMHIEILSTCLMKRGEGLLMSPQEKQLLQDSYQLSCS